MANIESVSHETRVFEPPREFAAQANVTKAQFDQMNAIAAKDYSGFWAKLAQGELLWHKPFTQVARRIQRAVLQMVRGRRTQCVVQLPRSQSGERQCRKDRDHLRGRRRRGDARHVSRSLSSRLPFRQRAQVAGHQERRPRHRLHADVDRGRRRDAGMRAHRRHALGRLRRLFRQVAAGADHRRRRHRGDHRRRAGARRQAPAAQGDRRRGAGTRRLRSDRQRHRLPAHRRQGRVLRAARRVDARTRGEAGRHLRARVGGRRAPAVHPLYLGIDRQAEGRAAQFGRLSAVGDPDHEVDLRHQARGHVLVHRRHRLGHRPHVHHLRPAGGRRDRDRVRRHSHVSRRGPLLADHTEAQVLDLLYRADGDPLADQGLRRQSADRAEELRSVDRCACSAASASRSIPRHGCGTTTTWAAAAARSSTRSGRPKPAAT